MISKNQLEHLVVRPTLMQIPNGFSESAVLAVMMIIAHESNKGYYLKQLGDGPALGLIQMEAATYRDVWQYGDSCRKNAVSCKFIKTILDEPPECHTLIFNLAFNVFMARQRLFMKPEALPTNIDAMGEYLKRHWNTVLGKATPSAYAEAYRNW